MLYQWCLHTCTLSSKKMGTNQFQRSGHKYLIIFFSTVQWASEMFCLSQSLVEGPLLVFVKTHLKQVHEQKNWRTNSCIWCEACKAVHIGNTPRNRKWLYNAWTQIRHGIQLRVSSGLYERQSLLAEDGTKFKSADKIDSRQWWYGLSIFRAYKGWIEV